MASNREILEAQRYNRKRMITAFTSGTPGGRELEHKSPIRPLFIGGIVCVVMILIAAVVSRFLPVLPEGWQSNTLVVVKGTGARYFSIKGVLRPVSNITSARLLAESGQFRMAEVNADTIAGVPRGSEVGIPEAPDLLPAATSLSSEVWASCGTASGGLHTWVGTLPESHRAEAAALVSNKNEIWLISGVRRYRVADPRVLLALGLEAAKVHPIDGRWLNLYQDASKLAPFDIKQSGSPFEGGSGALARAVVGQVIEIKEGSAVRRFVLMSGKTYRPLSDLAYRIYRLTEGVARKEPIKASVADMSGLKMSSSAVAPGSWPEKISQVVKDGRRVCSRLVVSDKGYVTELGSIAVPGTAQGPAASESQGVTVAGGSGALVRANSGGSLGATSVVTDLGVAYGIGGQHDMTLEQLGYSTSDVREIPASWIDLIPSGVELSAAAAWATVKEQ